MNIPIPTEFEAFAREQVKAGLTPSEADAAAEVLRGYVRHVEDVRSLVDPALTEADGGLGMDGDTFMKALIARTRMTASE